MHSLITIHEALQDMYATKMNIIKQLSKYLLTLHNRYHFKNFSAISASNGSVIEG